MSRYGFENLDFGHLLAKFIFEGRDNRHDRRGATRANAREPHGRDAVRNLQHLDPVAVQLESWSDLVFQGELNAVAKVHGFPLVICDRNELTMVATHSRP